MIPTRRAESDDDVTDLLSVLIRREQVVRTLVDRRQGKPELVATLGSSRSTVDRAIDELERRAIVERSDGQYGVTYFGRVVLMAFDRFETDLVDLLNLRSLLRGIPADTQFDSAVFDGATVEYVRAFGPDVVEATFGEATRARVASPLVATIYGTVAQGDDALDDVAVEFLLDRETLAHVEGFYTEELSALGGLPNVEVFEVAEKLPFCLSLAANDDAEWMTLLFPADGDTVAVLSNDGPAAVEWGEATYERLRAEPERYLPAH